MTHCMLDAYCGNFTLLNDMAIVNDALNEIATVFDLRTVMPPFVLPYYYAKKECDDGISAFVILRGGHITLHTFPHLGCLYADVLCDSEIDGEKFCSLLSRRFLLTKVDLITGEGKTYDKSASDNFGPHTVATVTGAKVTFEQIFDMLDGLPQIMGMTPISRPYVIKYRCDGYEYISGVALIAESHLAFHYCKTTATLYCDAFSCLFYNVDGFANYIKSKFDNVTHNTFVRGVRHGAETANVRDGKIKKLSRWINSITE